MKKFFAAALASAMVVTMAATSFAATTQKVADIVDANFRLDSDGVVKTDVNSGTVPYGKTLYYSIVDSDTAGITEYDAVRGSSIKQQWDMNGSAIEKVEIIKKKNEAGKYFYYLAVKTKDNTITSSTDVSGKVEVKKSSPSAYSFETKTVNVAFTLGYEKATAKTVNSTIKVYDFGAVSTTDNTKLGSDEEDTIEFAGGYMTVNTVGQGKMLMSLSTKYNADIAAKYPEANLDFVTFNGASFNKTGELTIEADKGSFLYVNKDGVLTAVKASYDEYEEAFKVKTRTLSAFVISDVELKAVTTTPVDPAKPNPGTGANA